MKKKICEEGTGDEKNTFGIRGCVVLCNALEFIA
jgi:hypothetical protein